MSQIDKLNYIPLLFWFCFLFFIFYFFIFSYILPLIFCSLKVRSFFFSELLSDIIFAGSFLSFLSFIYKKNSSYLFFIKFLLSLVSNLFALKKIFSDIKISSFF